MSGSLVIGMAAKDGRDDMQDDEEQRLADTSQSTALYAGARHKGSWGTSKGRSWKFEGESIRHRWQGCASWRETPLVRGWRRGGNGHEKGGKRDRRLCWNSGAKGHLAALCPKSRQEL